MFRDVSQKKRAANPFLVAIPEGLEPSTDCLEGSCSIQLSYGTVAIYSLWSGWQDSNLRPPAPKAGAITGLRYTPSVFSRMVHMRDALRCLSRGMVWRERDSNPRYAKRAYGSLANCWFKPLTHLSFFQA